jgi:hypothetical protein
MSSLSSIRPRRVGSLIAITSVRPVVLTLYSVHVRTLYNVHVAAQRKRHHRRIRKLPAPWSPFRKVPRDRPSCLRCRRPSLSRSPSCNPSRSPSRRRSGYCHTMLRTKSRRTMRSLWAHPCHVHPLLPRGSSTPLPIAPSAPHHPLSQPSPLPRWLHLASASLRGTRRQVPLSLLQSFRPWRSLYHPRCNEGR